MLGFIFSSAVVAFFSYFFFFKKILSELLSECQIVKIQIRWDIILHLNCLQDYQQMSWAGKELNKGEKLTSL